MTPPSDPGTPPPTLTGRIGKYEIVQPIGKGAMGQVYLARDTVLERDVALKVMAAQIADDAELKTRFEREARAAAKITHPNVVTVFDLGSLADGSLYIAMEHLKGQDLQKAMRSAPPMSLEHKVAVIVQVLAGLAHAHQQGIVHRDIKPANIFIQGDGSVKIMDFGVARLATAAMTGTGNILGTADYMSPEQVRGEKSIDGRSDLFSVGCMLFELLVGRRPFHSDNLMAIFYKITHEDASFDGLPPGPEQLALRPILRKALARKLEDRYQTAYEFAVDLGEWLRLHGASASARSAVQVVGGIAAQTHAPAPLTDAPGATVAPPDEGAAPDLASGRRPSRAGNLAATTVQSSSRTVVMPAARAGATRGLPPPAARPLPRARVAERRSPIPWIVAVVLAASAVGGGYAYWLARQAATTTAPSTVPSTEASEPPATLPPPPVVIATPEPPPVTVAPQPTFTEEAGRVAASLRAARAAFKAGEYDRAVAAAQEAAREDPSSRAAQEVLTQALAGQKASERVAGAEGALARNDLAAAETAVDEALRLAPWDARAVALSGRIREAKAEAQRTQQEAQRQAAAQRAARVNELLQQATAALAAKQYDAAIRLYDQVLEIDAANPTAQMGKTGAISSKNMAAEAATAPRPAARAFVTGPTQKRSPEAKAGAVPEGFEATSEVQVKRGTQAAELPGRIGFRVSPDPPRPGQPFTIDILLTNDGAQPIPLAAGMRLVTTINGAARPGTVAPVASTVAPGQTAVIFQVGKGETWREGWTAWFLEVTVYTARGEEYRSTLTWK